ncbi:MAG: hypothetical protein MZU95_14405 [Desulfomicrobium escambiense]|nr:hypothetical protein [Desulfomicrobium escambiense]
MAVNLIFVKALANLICHIADGLAQYFLVVRVPGESYFLAYRFYLMTGDDRRIIHAIGVLLGAVDSVCSRLFNLSNT